MEYKKVDLIEIESKMLKREWLLLEAEESSEERVLESEKNKLQCVIAQ
jgi:hypothetical protein